MAFLISYKHLSFFVISMSIFHNYCRGDEHPAEAGAAEVLANQYLPSSGDVDEYTHHSGSNDDEYPYQGGGGGDDHDPAQFVNTALECFGNNYLYQSCEETYRLTATGNLHVPPDYTNEYCGGSCVKETHLVLSCIEGILSHFLFYNKATIFDIRETIKTGCSYGPKRGDFDVSKHLQYEEGSAKRATFTIVFVIVFALCYLFL